MTTFDDLGLAPAALHAVETLGYETPTPVQEKAIPLVLAGRDIIAAAKTGTGKTAAFSLPTMDGLSHAKGERGPLMLVVTPTRELAAQIAEVCTTIALSTHHRVLSVVGGVSYNPQISALKRGCDVLIATPGRLIDLMEQGAAHLSHVEVLVLDEADRMLDMGFSEDIKMIASKLPATCQTIMFSATMPQKIEELAKTLLKNPVEIKIAVSRPAEKIKQSAYVCYETQKIGIIKDLFKKGDLNRVIIFSGKKQKVKAINRALQQMKINSGEMHSDLEQAERDEILYKFKTGQIDVLVATDIVARGIDIDDIAMVINFDVPHDPEDYVHRIGRTARAERDGIAITFVSEDEISSFKQIEKFLGREVEKNPLPEGLGEAPDYNAIHSKGGRGRGGRSKDGEGRNSEGRSQKRGGRRNGADRKNKDEKENSVSKEDVQNKESRPDKENVNPAAGEDTAATRKKRSRKPRRKPTANKEQQGNEASSEKNGNAENNKRKTENNKRNAENGKANGERNADNPQKRNGGQRRRQQRKPGEENGKSNRRNTERKPKVSTTENVPAVKQSSSLTQILKKPISWLKALGKKKD